MCVWGISTLSSTASLDQGSSFQPPVIQSFLDCNSLQLCCFLRGFLYNLTAGQSEAHSNRLYSMHPLFHYNHGCCPRATNTQNHNPSQSFFLKQQSEAYSTFKALLLGGERIPPGLVVLMILSVLHILCDSSVREGKKFPKQKKIKIQFQ